MDAARILTKARQQSGLTQQQLAHRAATSQSAIAAYEAGKRQPTLPVLKRLVEATGFTLSVELAQRPGLLRLADLARYLREEPDEKHRLRLFFEFLRGAGESGQTLGPLIEAEPPPTGDERYDALLAASAEHLAVHAKVPIPGWTQDPRRTIDGFWWVSDLPSAKAQALLHTPASYRRRGVMIDRHDLEAA